MSQRVFAVCERNCSCNHPSVHPWLRLGFSIEHLPCRKMFKRHGWYGSDNNDQHATGVMFKEESDFLPQTKIWLFGISKILRFLQSSFLCLFFWILLKRNTGLSVYFFSHVHEDFQHNVTSKRIPMTIFVVSSLIHVFSL